MHFSEIELIPSPKELISRMAEFRPDIVLLDMNFHTDINTGNEGLYWLSEIKKRCPDIEVVLFTAYADIALAVEGMKRGAFDFIVKPWENEKLVETLKQAYTNRNKDSYEAVQTPASSIRMQWGKGPAMAAIHKTIEKISSTDASVLITGENGTGKDVLAGEIHHKSTRSLRPMVCVDAGAVTETLFESELFGHVKGAFTDAHADKPGKFEQADGGTLFLDEIGNLSYALQAKMLTALQNRTVTRVGGRSEIRFDIRLITATNRNVESMVAEQTFRQDLFYRINTIALHLPPLRERAADIVPLAEMFLSRYASAYGRPVPALTPDAAQKLTAYPWPGNIRQLQHTMERTLILTDGTEICAAHLQLPTASAVAPSVQGVQTLEDVERETIARAVAECEGNMSAVAQRLGITRQTLYNKIKKYGI